MPTWTPVPTLALETKRTNLKELLATNRGCEFPCWWGVRPGDDIQKALLLATTLGRNPYVYGTQYSYGFPFDESNIFDLNVTFYENLGIVQKMKVVLEEPSRSIDYRASLEKAFSLSSILNHYGRPTNILLEVIPRAEIDSSISYVLAVIYQPDGFGVKYEGIVDSEEPLLICPATLENYHLEMITFYLQDSMAMETLQDELYYRGAKSIEDATSMGLDGFFQAFSSGDEDNCITTLIELWK